MRVGDFTNWRGVFGLLFLAATGCQTAQKPVSLLPPAQAPALGPATGSSKTSTSAKASAVSGPNSSLSQPNSESPTPQTPKPAPQTAQATSAQAAAASADPVADLIARAEKEYQAGLANFQQGNAEAAKQNFDNAFNALLDSNVDIRSDDRLEKEFDHLVAGVNKLSIGDNAADSEAPREAQKSEPAPIDETNGLTPAADPSVKAKAQAELKATHSDLPLMMTDQVAGYISYFSNRGRGVYERALARSGRYQAMMRSILRQEGVPQDLIYLAQAESGFHPLAVSRVGARGIWQFMGSRARGYGLEHNMYIDDRQDPEKSTRAAARHLKDLYNQFGDWYLAMAAYNSGPGTVQAAVKRTGYADFWELYRRNVLPKETKNYVPIILAVTIMAKNPGQYGMDDVNLDSPDNYDRVTIDYPVDLRLVADCVGSTPSQLLDLNPRLLRMTTPRDGSFELHLPAGTLEAYQTTIASVPADKRLFWRYHVVQPGETLASVGREYHTTAGAIARANHLDGTDELETEAKLVVPVEPGKRSLNDGGTYARRITRYKVRRGDTVETVAENFGVPAQMLRRWNGLRSNTLAGRRVLALHLPITPNSSAIETASASRKTTAMQGASKTARTTEASDAAAKKSAGGSASSHEDESNSQISTVRHKVRSGETLYSIANAYNTTVAALKRDNRDIAVLRPGMILIVQPAR